MSIIATKPESKERELIPAGMQQAYLSRIVYLGTQKKEWKGKAVQSQRIWVEFEFPQFVVDFEDKSTKEKKTFVKTVGVEYTLSLSEMGNLLPMIQGWLGRKLTHTELESFDVCSLLGNPALVNITHSAPNAKGKVYENIAGVNPVMQGFQMIPRYSEPVEIGKSEWNTLMNTLPDFLQDKIKSSNEWLQEQGNQGTGYDDIPTINLDDEIKVEDVM